jgi:hypothetical protein
MYITNVHHQHQHLPTAPSFDVDAAFMSPQLRERGIHAV